MSLEKMKAERARLEGEFQKGIQLRDRKIQELNELNKGLERMVGAHQTLNALINDCEPKPEADAPKNEKVVPISAAQAVGEKPQ